MDEKYSVTYEFSNEMFMKDFIDSVNDSDWREWVEFKMKTPIKEEMSALDKIREIIGELYG